VDKNNIYLLDARLVTCDNCFYMACWQNTLLHAAETAENLIDKTQNGTKIAKIVSNPSK